MSILDEIQQNIDNDVDIDEIMDAGLSVERDITPDDVDIDQLERGIEVEMEHTTNREVAKKIALDHLAEIPDYYDRLDDMEDEAGI